MNIEYYAAIGAMICIYAILAVSLNIVTGFTGLLNLGHAAFFAMGAYTSAFLGLLGVPFWISMILGGFVSCFFGFLIGGTSLRLRGDYLAIATLGFGEIIRIILKNWNSLTRGPLGLVNIPRPHFFGFMIQKEYQYFLLYFFIAAICILIMIKIVHSPFGRVLRSIREDELATASLGKNVFRYKVQALMIGSFFAGIAGSMFSHKITYIEPSSFGFLESVLILCMIVRGGLGSIRGSIIGAGLLIIFPEIFKFIVQHWIPVSTEIEAGIKLMLYGILLVILMLYKPDGLFGEKKHAATEIHS